MAGIGTVFLMASGGIMIRFVYRRKLEKGKCCTVSKEKVGK